MYFIDKVNSFLAATLHRILLAILFYGFFSNVLYAADWSIQSTNYSSMYIECTLSGTSGSLGDMGYYSNFTATIIPTGLTDVSLVMKCTSFDEPWIKAVNCTESSYKSSKTWTIKHNTIAGFAFMHYPARSEICEQIYKYGNIVLKKN